MLDYALAAYLGCQILAWALGQWDRIPALARPATPPPLAAPAPGTSDTARHLAAPAAPPAATATVAVVGLTAHGTLAVRATLAVMAASMSYMLIAM